MWIDSEKIGFGEDNEHIIETIENESMLNEMPNNVGTFN